MIEIHKAASEDMAGLCRVQQETSLATYPHEDLGITPELILASKDFDSPVKIAKRIEQLDDPLLRYWVARYDGQVIGFAIARKTTAEKWVRAMYILPRFQGLGVGRKFMDKMLAWLGEGNVMLEVATYNKGGIAFYERMGFVEADVPHGREELNDGFGIPTLTMIKQVHKHGEA